MIKRIRGLFLFFISGVCLSQAAYGQSHLLYSSPTQGNYYRIPAIATAYSGDLVTVTDLRYLHHADLNNHRIDLLVCRSTNNGATWLEPQNLTEAFSTDSTGYGDAALAADVESGRMLVLCASGQYGYGASNRQRPIRVSRLGSEDNGKTWTAPQDITQSIYGLDSRWQSLFFASGRIAQSRLVKVGKYYRLYAALLSRGYGNYVLYSDDFGDTWHVLGGTSLSPVPRGDEAKVEELADGTVVISSRTQGGRFLNCFTYEDRYEGTGQWDRPVLSSELYGTACNGEWMKIPVCVAGTDTTADLLLQSVPAAVYREKVSIYYKLLSKDSTYTPSSLATGWKVYQVTTSPSAYSTFCLQNDGRLGFYYESEPGIYGMVYKPISIETLTNGAYRIAKPSVSTFMIDAFSGVVSDSTVTVIIPETEELLSPTLTARLKGASTCRLSSVGDSCATLSVAYDNYRTTYRLLFKPLPSPVDNQDEGDESLEQEIDVALGIAELLLMFL